MRRVFLGPVEIAGYYAALQPGLESLGYRVLRTDLWQDRRQYAIRRPPLFARLAIAAHGRGVEHRARRAAQRSLWFKLESLLLWALFVRVLLACDTFVYAYGATITWHPSLELRLLRLLRRRLVVVFHGSDTRPPYLDGQIMASDRHVSIADCAALTAAQKAKVSMLTAAADAVICSPTFAHFHERPFVNWHAVGIPSAAPLSAEVASARAHDGPVRVLHAPSHPESKGTPLVRAAIERLRARGRDIDYVEVIGQPHAAVLAELARCDFVVDAAFCDVPMSGFATEAAALARPSVVGGPSAEAFDETIAPDDMPPVLYCPPEDMEDAIDRLVTDADFRRALGARAREFVANNRDPRVVARRFARVLEGDVPDAWMFDPARLRHVGGFGSPELLRRTVRDLVDAFGASALQLDDKPELRALVLTFGFGHVPAAATDAQCETAGQARPSADMP